MESRVVFLFYLFLFLSFFLCVRACACVGCLGFSGVWVGGRGGGSTNLKISLVNFTFSIHSHALFFL